jgi:hypothetical protein
MIEEYPEYSKGHCALFLQSDQYEQPIHTVWGIPEGFSKPAVLVTAYRPEPKKWNENFTKRRKQ